MSMNNTTIQSDLSTPTGSRGKQPLGRRLGLISLLTATLLVGCGGGADTVTNDDFGGGNPGGSTYNGPAPANEDIQSFKLNVWDNISPDNRCGSCHSPNAAKPQTPYFANKEDVNAAYAAALSLMNRTLPGDSRLVSKVATPPTGHNCWETSPSACGDVMTRWIANWASTAGSGAGRTITLKAPESKDPGASKSFPVDSALFASTIHPLLTAHCSGCHEETAATPQSPFFANSDVDSAYAAVKAKIDLGDETRMYEDPVNPEDSAKSRLTLRLRDEFHNCWSSDCKSDGQEMHDAIVAFAGGISVTAVDPAFVTSKALNLIEDGIVASGGSRSEPNLIAIWEFKTGTGTTAFDTSGIDPAVNLTFSGSVDWVGGWGIQLNGATAKAQASTTASTKLYDMLRSSGEYSIEAWIIPGNVTQEDAYIFSYSGGSAAPSRNFTIGQTMYNYDFMNNSRDTGSDGTPALSTDDDEEVLQAALQHVVMTFDPANGRRIYVNGELRASGDVVNDASLADWKNNFAFVLGNDTSNDRPWSGIIRMVAVHNRALTLEQVQQNFAVGVGEKFFLLFGVAAQTGITDSYVMFEVSQFDSYSYLFDQPTFIILDPAVTPGDIPLKGMRIGINGKEAAAGQAYKRLDTMINSSDYTPAGQRLSPVGTIIALEKGPAADQFFLTFEQLGTCGPACENVDVEAVPPRSPTYATGEASDVGVRTFDEINASMSQVTGISMTNSAVSSTFDQYEQQFPTVEAMDGFLSSHQMAIAQLAMTYCDQLVQNDKPYFAPFNFGVAATSAFDTAAERDQLLDSLLNRMMQVDLGTPANNLATQPDETVVREMLGGMGTQNLDASLGGAGDYQSLITTMLQCTTDTAHPLYPCNTTARTEQIATAACAAVLGSAAMLAQ